MKTLLSPIAVEICKLSVRLTQHPQECPECQNRINIALLILDRLGDQIRRDGGRRRGRISKVSSVKQ